MKVIDIVKERLQADGFTGLRHPDAACGCELSDLAPCGSVDSECQPGHKHMDPRPGHEGNWMICGHSEPPTLEKWEGVDS